MAQPLIFVWFIVLLTSQPSATMTLQQHCTQKIAGKIKYSVNDGLQDYFRICRSVDDHVDCILSTRNTTPPEDVTVEAYEKVFPDDYDLRRAGFLFCSRILAKTLAAIGDDNMNVCQDKVDFQKCKQKYMTPEKKSELQTALTSEDIELAKNISCEMSALYQDCVRTEHVIKCGSQYKGIMNYELGKLGGKCLASHNIHSPLVTLIVCPRGTISGSKELVSFHAAKALFSLTVIIVLLN